MELLAPAGNLEKLKTAIRFGADAVYCGAGSYSLRTAEASFTLEELADGILFAHEQNCRVYLALNIFAFDEDLQSMTDYLKRAVDAGIDAVIMSDPGMIARVRKSWPDLKIHLSTQANTTNSESVLFWRDQGVNRIVLARELSLAQVALIRGKAPDVELEVFVHGAMCVAYSGRCLLSAVLAERSGNRGECAQPCRWEYRLREAVQGDELTVMEDERGTYLLNSRDLCMIKHIPALSSAGVHSLKIEGRMKTSYYVAAVTRVYRAALDRYTNAMRTGNLYEADPSWSDELSKVSHRPYTTGFYLPHQPGETEYVADAAYIRGYDFVGMVEEGSVSDDSLVIKARNRFAVGDRLEILDPGHEDIATLDVQKMINCRTGSDLKEAHNSYLVRVFPSARGGEKVSGEAIVRKKARSE